MDGALSQEEINALLSSPGEASQEAVLETMTDDEKDAIGEIGNIRRPEGVPTGNCEAK